MTAIASRRPKTLMILGGGHWQTFMVDQARRCGVRTVVIDCGQNPPARALADIFYPVDTSQVDAAIDVARREKVDGVATFGTHDAIVTVACIKEALGLPSDCVSSEAARRAVQKDVVRDRLAQAGVPIPQGQVLPLASGDACDEAVRFLNALGRPVLLKPSDTSGGKGISIVRRKDELPTAIERARRAVLRRGAVLIEEFVEGTVIGVESVTRSGQTIPVIIADKQMGPPPYCVTLGVVGPSSLPAAIQQRVLEVNAATIRALEIETGPTHIDMVVDHDGVPRVIDVGPRLAGGPIIFEIARRTMDVDMIQHVIDGALGNAAMLTPRWTGVYGGSRHFVANSFGTIRQLSCPQAVIDLNRVTCLHFWKQVGDVIQHAHDDTHTLGFAVCLGPTFDETLRRLDAVAAAVTCEVEEIPAHQRP